jgi:type I restriction-modification system DNA methylase subunit
MSQATLGSAPYRNSNLFTNYYLDNRVQDLEQWDRDEEAEAVFDQLRDLWEFESGLVDTYGEDELLDSWIDEVLSALGYDSLSETTLPDSGGYTDRLLFESREVRADAARRRKDGETEAMFGKASAVLEAKQWGADFDERFSERRSYRDASHQIKYYLERTPEETKWGILTNGKQWRLYGTKDYATETFYEVDLPELLETGDLETFKYFYAFFRPEAFTETAGTSFLDTVWNESETAAQELGEDLQDSVFTALRILAEGFIETNDLDISADDEEELAELKEQSLVLLYRLMFVFYAESRHLIDPDDADKQAEYRENFSLNQLRREIYEEISGGEDFEDYSTFSKSFWSRLEDLFELVDTGEDALDIPPYNGGLFDSGDHEFLTENEVADRYIAEVLYRIGTTEADDGTEVLADYADLDTRHLGSIYEGLLEHEFRIAPEQYAAVSEDGGQVWKPATEVSVAEAVETVEDGELYVVNDDGERKATGAYYTPDYVVTYIVEETVDPLLEEIDEELRADGLEPSDREYFRRYWQSVLDLTILDPAMGSGHFLTKATGYLTERVMEVVRAQEIQGYDEQDLRREIAKECIYGVDVNGMAVELAKLSMWLETLAADKPLAFLDHHLKTGNSLVGSNIHDVLDEQDETDGEGMQTTLFDDFEQIRRDTLKHVRELIDELVSIDNNDLDDIKRMERKYTEIRHDPAYRRLLEFTNVHTAERFGLDVPEEAYRTMAGAIDNEAEWESEVVSRDWFATAQVMAIEEGFFHWELEFPEVFLNGAAESGDSGFDVVVGNPPYVRQEQLAALKPFLKSKFDSYHSAADLYTYFIERGKSLLGKGRDLGFITSNKFLDSEYGDSIRGILAEDTSILKAFDFHSLPVFSDGVSAYPLVFIFKNEQVEENHTTIGRVRSLEFSELREELSEIEYVISQDKFVDSGWKILPPEVTTTISSIEEDTEKLVDYLDVPLRRGLLTGLNDAFILSKDDSNRFSDDFEHLYELLKGEDVHRYRIEYNRREIIAVPSGWTRKESGKTNEDAAWEWFKQKYPSVAEHLSPYESKAKQRHDRGEFWWELRPCNYYDDLTNSKIVYPVISSGPNFSIDEDGLFINDKLYSIPKKDYSLLGLLNSKLVHFWVQASLSGLRGDFQEFRAVHVEKVPIPKGIRGDNDIEELSQKAIRLRGNYDDLNLNLFDYISVDSKGPTVTEIGFCQPPKNAADSILQETAEEKPKLKIGTATVTRESETSVVINLTARYKPDNPEDYETDAYDYTETDPQPALKISDLTETEADLIEAFVPVAVDKAEGFANFRKNATKRNSLVDRLRKLTLPRVADVRDGLESYQQTMERATELEEKIEHTDELIDEIVYELYGLTDEEIEIVEESVGD